MNLGLAEINTIITNLNDKDDGSSTPGYFSRTLEDDEEAIRRLQWEHQSYPTIEAAYNAMLDQTKIDPNEKINELKKLYNNRLYEELAKRLTGDCKIDFIVAEMKAYI